MRASCASILFLLAGCTEVIDVDHYSFDINPCEELPVRECGDTGEEFSYIIVDSDITRSMDGQLDGFDLDGTNRTVCGQRDFVSPSGVEGIDNQIAGLVVTFENLTGTNVRDSTRMNLLAGTNLQLIRVRNIDDFSNDSCITLEHRRAYLPEGTSTADLDANLDGEIDAGLMFDYRVPSTASDSSACIIDGVVHARFSDSMGLLPFLQGEYTSQRGRLRLPITRDQLGPGTFGGSGRLDDIATLFADQAEVLDFVRTRADLDETAEGCISISYAIVLRGAPAELGLPLSL